MYKSRYLPKIKSEKIAENCCQMQFLSDGKTSLNYVMAEAEIDNIEIQRGQYCDWCINIWFAKVLCFVCINLNGPLFIHLCYSGHDKDHSDDCV